MIENMLKYLLILWCDLGKLTSYFSWKIFATQSKITNEETGIQPLWGTKPKTSVSYKIERKNAEDTPQKFLTNSATHFGKNSSKILEKSFEKSPSDLPGFTQKSDKILKCNNVVLSQNFFDKNIENPIENLPKYSYDFEANNVRLNNNFDKNFSSEGIQNFQKFDIISQCFSDVFHSEFLYDIDDYNDFIREEHFTDIFNNVSQINDFLSGEISNYQEVVKPYTKNLSGKFDSSNNNENIQSDIKFLSRENPSELKFSKVFTAAFHQNFNENVENLISNVIDSSLRINGFSITSQVE